MPERVVAAAYADQEVFRLHVWRALVLAAPAALVRPLLCVNLDLSKVWAGRPLGSMERLRLQATQILHQCLTPQLNVLH
jgi:hypothetical protein